MSRFAILMYHRIVSDDCPVPDADADERRYGVSLEEFVWQIDRMAGAGKRGVSVRRIHDHVAAGHAVPEEWVGVTFDDGNLSDYVHALPLLRERDFDATFYVCGNRVGTGDGLSREMIHEMSSAGMHMAAHGMTHRFMTTLSGEEEARELEESKTLLEDVTGMDVDHFAPPGGRISARTHETLSRLGYRAVADSRYGFNGARARGPYRRIPVVDATSRAEFDHIIHARVASLLPRFARAAALRSLKAVLGEDGYRRLRGASMER